MDDLRRLQAWYQSQCDGDWEHQHGVSIDTLDKPGWSLRIDAAGTDPERATFKTVSENYGHERDWLICKCEDGVFTVHSGPRRLHDAVRIFLDRTDHHAESAG